MIQTGQLPKNSILPSKCACDKQADVIKWLKEQGQMLSPKSATIVLDFKELNWGKKKENKITNLTQLPQSQR